MKVRSALIFAVQLVVAGVRSGVMWLARKAARFERHIVSRLADLPGGLIDLAVLGTLGIGRSAHRMFPLLLTILLIVLFFLLQY